MNQLVTYRNAAGSTYRGLMTQIDNVTADGTLSMVYINTQPYHAVEVWVRKHDENHAPAQLHKLYAGWVYPESIVEPLCNKCGSVLEMETSGGGYTDMGDPQPAEVDWMCPNCDDDMEEF